MTKNLQPKVIFLECAFYYSKADMANKGAIIFLGRGVPNILGGGHKFLERKIGGWGGHKIVEDQNVGSHKIVCLFCSKRMISIF